MLDARYFAFAALSALLVISPGATLAVVVETALGYGRKAALLTVIGIGLGNATLASATAFGLSAVVDRWPSALQFIRFAGGVYLAGLGLRSLRRALSEAAPDKGPEKGPEKGPGPNSRARMADSAQGPAQGPGPFALIAKGMLTNLLNPPVILFYVTMVPQFIGPRDPYLARALLLGATHVGMSILWQGSCGVAVGMVAERMTRTAVRRTLEGITGAVLVFLGARLVL